MTTLLGNFTRWATTFVGIRVILIDLWKTLARSKYPEPIALFKTLLGLDGKVEDEDFLRLCLTTPHEDCEQYMRAVAAACGLDTIPVDALAKFESIVRIEKDNLLIYTDVHKVLWQLKEQGYKIGLLTNSWPFPVRALLKSTGLDRLFDEVIISAEVGIAKQDGPEIYYLAAQRFGVRPEECCMIGDNPDLDILPAYAARVVPVLIDRDETYVDGAGMSKRTELHELGIGVIRNLDELPTVLRCGVN